MGKPDTGSEAAQAKASILQAVGEIAAAIGGSLAMQRLRR